MALALEKEIWVFRKWTGSLPNVSFLTFFLKHVFISTKLRVLLRNGAAQKMVIKSTTGLTEVHFPCCSIQGGKSPLNITWALLQSLGPAYFFCRTMASTVPWKCK